MVRYTRVRKHKYRWVYRCTYGTAGFSSSVRISINSYRLLLLRKSFGGMVSLLKTQDVVNPAKSLQRRVRTNPSSSLPTTLPRLTFVLFFFSLLFDKRRTISSSLFLLLLLANNDPNQIDFNEKHDPQTVPKVTVCPNEQLPKVRTNWSWLLRHGAQNQTKERWPNHGVERTRLRQDVRQRKTVGGLRSQHPA